MKSDHDNLALAPAYRQAINEAIRAFGAEELATFVVAEIGQSPERLVVATDVGILAITIGEKQVRSIESVGTLVPWDRVDASFSVAVTSADAGARHALTLRLGAPIEVELTADRWMAEALHDVALELLARAHPR
jgi:hypothetical protein